LVGRVTAHARFGSNAANSVSSLSKIGALNLPYRLTLRVPLREVIHLKDVSALRQPVIL